MSTLLRVLSDAEISEIHEQSLAVLARTGMRVDSERARRILEGAGAQVDHGDRRVRFPRSLVEASLAAAPKQFSLGGRREGFALPMNAGECTLMPDGETTMFYDPVTGERRAPTWDDWANATKLVGHDGRGGRVLADGHRWRGGSRPGAARRATGASATGCSPSTSRTRSRARDESESGCCGCWRSSSAAGRRVRALHPF